MSTRSVAISLAMQSDAMRGLVSTGAGEAEVNVYAVRVLDLVDDAQVWHPFISSQVWR